MSGWAGAPLASGGRGGESGTVIEKLDSHWYILLTIALTVYGQSVVKWQLNLVTMPQGAAEKLWFAAALLTNIWVLSGFVSYFLAALCWMVALSRFEISYAYPFMSISFVLVFLLGALLFKEPLTVAKVAGMTLIAVGIVVLARG